MEPWLAFAIIVGVPVFIMILIGTHHVGWMRGFDECAKIDDKYISRLTSRPTQKSGAPPPERGSDDTG